MAYVIKRRQIGDYVAPAPYANADSRYVRERENARQFSRYVEAFNACRGNETVEEF